MTQTSGSPSSRSERKTILVPSGDHPGWLEKRLSPETFGVSVSLVRPLPSALTTQTSLSPSGPPRKAIRAPSGDHAACPARRPAGSGTVVHAPPVGATVRRSWPPVVKTIRPSSPGKAAAAGAASTSAAARVSRATRMSFDASRMVDCVNRRQRRRIGLSMSRLAVTLAAAALALAPASAHAACAIPDLDGAPIDVVARPLPGPAVPGGGLLSPAWFAVKTYLKGDGPPMIPVTTGATLLPTGVYSLVGEGLFPHPGELWRLYGSFDNGVLQSGTCNGSHTLPDPPPAPSLTAAGRTVTPLPSNLAGVTAARAPHVRIASRVLKLRSSLPLLSVRSARNDRELARATGKGIAWNLKLPAGESRVVVDTGDRAYTFGVLSKLSHR